MKVPYYFYYTLPILDDYGRGMRMDLGRGEGNKRRGARNEPEPPAKETPPPAQAVSAPPRQETDVDDKPIPDDLSEISDDPDDILNREDVCLYLRIFFRIPFKFNIFSHKCIAKSTLVNFRWLIKI